VVGVSSTSGGLYHAFIGGNGAMTDLGTLGGAASFAYGVNSTSQVVGEADTPTARHAFYYDGTTMYDLNNLIPPGSGWVLQQGWAINDSGQIAGDGTINGVTHAFLLTPGPSSHVPSAIGLSAGSPSSAAIADGSGLTVAGAVGPMAPASLALAPADASVNSTAVTALPQREGDADAATEARAVALAGPTIITLATTIPAGAVANPAAVAWPSAAVTALAQHQGDTDTTDRAAPHAAPLQGSTPASMFDQPAASLAALDAAFADLAAV
jgi:probable HAF family extracellular repeat protein